MTDHRPTPADMDTGEVMHIAAGIFERRPHGLTLRGMYDTMIRTSPQRPRFDREDELDAWDSLTTWEQAILAEALDCYAEYTAPAQHELQAAYRSQAEPERLARRTLAMTLDGPETPLYHGVQRLRSERPELTPAELMEQGLALWVGRELAQYYTAELRTDR